MIQHRNSLEFTQWIWHKSAVPLFAERFILAVLAVSFAAVTITNPMQLDRTQRVSAAFTIVFAAYFLAHTLYKNSHPVPQRFFEAEIFQAFQLADKSHMWVINEQSREAYPVDLYFEIRLTNTSDGPLVIDNFRIDIKGKNDEWVKLTTFPYSSPSIEKLFWGESLNKVSLVATDPPDIWTQFSSPFQPNEPKVGSLICEFKPPFSNLQAGPPQYRISILDNKQRLSVIEPTLPIPGSGQNVVSTFKFGSPSVDLSSFNERRFIPLTNTDSKN